MLQGDIYALEQEKVQLTKKLDMLSKKVIHAGIMGSQYTSSELLWIVHKKPKDGYGLVGPLVASLA